MPANEGLKSRVLGKAKLGVLLGGIGIPVFGSLPEFTVIRSLEWNHVFLGLVYENAEAFL
jgi:hypothetical protein